MIFVTVGTQLPFDRMVAAVDAWAAQTGAKIFAQVGPTTREFKSINHQRFLEPAEFDRYFNEATLVVAHAGMGSILTALSFGKPIIIIPRRASLGEHRNDHQIATAKRFQSHSGVVVAWHEADLPVALDNLTRQDRVAAARISPYAPEPFIHRLRQLIES